MYINNPGNMTKMANVPIIFAVHLTNYKMYLPFIESNIQKDW